uniref:Uncharacterized protein n=1 Tax=Arundo donax TaxID=35708 RepID=A0A0A9T182_ARUDO
MTTFDISYPQFPKWIYDHLNQVTDDFWCSKSVLTGLLQSELHS